MAFKHQERAVIQLKRFYKWAALARRSNSALHTNWGFFAWVWFELVGNVAADVMPGTLVMGRYITGRVPRKRRAVPGDSSFVPDPTCNQAADISHHISEEH